MHPHEVEEMPTTLLFWRWEKLSKVVKPMDAFLLHLNWPLRDWDKPYWATGQPGSMRPRFVQRTGLIKALHEHCTFFRLLWLNIRAPALLTFNLLNTNASFLPDSFLCPWTKPFHFNTHNTDTCWCRQRLLFSTPTAIGSWLQSIDSQTGGS